MNYDLLQTNLCLNPFVLKNVSCLFLGPKIPHKKQPETTKLSAKSIKIRKGKSLGCVQILQKFSKLRAEIVKSYKMIFGSIDVLYCYAR